MSLAIGVNMERYILFATDTRMTRTWPSGQTEHRDGFRKIESSPMGLFTGTGHGDFIDRVTTRIRHESPSTIAALQQIVEPERAGIAQTTMTELDRDQLLNRSGFHFSYLARDAQGAPSLRFVQTHPDSQDGAFSVMPPYSLACLVTDEAISDYIFSTFESLAEPLQAVMDEVEHHAELMRRIIAHCATLTDCVSADCQIAVHFEDDRRLITGVLPAGEAVAWKRLEIADYSPTQPDNRGWVDDRTHGDYLKLAIAAQENAIIYAERLGDLLLAASVGYQLDTPEKLRAEHETVKRCLASMRAQLGELEAALVLDSLPVDQVH